MDIDYFIAQIPRLATIDANPTPHTFRVRLEHYGKKTPFRSIGFVTDIRSRSAENTEVVFGEPNEEQAKLMEGVLEHINGNVLVSVRGKLGQSPDVAKECKFICSSNYSRIPFMWRELTFPANFGKNPDFTVLMLPGHGSSSRTKEGKPLKVLRFPEKNFTLIVGTDYMGEAKKAFLTMMMYDAKQDGMLGLHAGTKVLYLKDKNGNPVTRGVAAFGLSGTGKTTLMCHNHALDQSNGGTIFKQDDIVIMRSDGYCYGTENNFYIKSEGLEPEGQRILWEAAMTNSAIYENVYIDPQTGEPDFLNYSLKWRGKEGRNGRIVVYRNEMRPFVEEGIDLERADIVLFICPSYYIDYPVVKLESPEWAAAALALGESVGTVAQGAKGVGEPKHEVAFNPFIIGLKEDDIHCFYEFVKKSKKTENPIECYIVNTGYVGVQKVVDGKPVGGEKVTVQDSAEIIKQIARGDIDWAEDKLWGEGYLIPLRIQGVSQERLKLLNPRMYYSADNYVRLVEEKMRERLVWLKKELPDLKKEIVDAVRGNEGYSKSEDGPRISNIEVE